MQYSSYKEMVKAEPWVEWQEMDDDFEIQWKPNTPQKIKDQYEKWLISADNFD